MVNSIKIVKLLKEIEELYEDIYPLIEGLPFDGPKDPSQSPLPYFQKATSICNNTEGFYKNLEEHLKERVREMRHCISQVTEWDMQHEGLNEADKIMFRKARGSQKHVIAKIMKKVST